MANCGGREADASAKILSKAIRGQGSSKRLASAAPLFRQGPPAHFDEGNRSLTGMGQVGLNCGLQPGSPTLALRKSGVPQAQVVERYGVPVLAVADTPRHTSELVQGDEMPARFIRGSAMS